MADEITLDITETITKVEVTEDVTSINITPNITSVELKGISISNAGSATAMAYAGESNTLGYGSTVAASLDHINTNGLNKNLDQTIDGNITFADGHTITFPDSGYTALELNDNSMNVAGITASADITSATKMEAPLFKGDLEGAVHFKASGSGLAKGDVVYITGYQGNKTTVDKADASDSAKMPAFGIVNATQGGNVDILTFGSMLHLSTTGIATGTELYVSASTPGGYETSAPTGEGNLVQKIAKVVRGDSNSGSIKIMGAGRTNATPNLNSGNIFLGNASNISTTASFDTTFGTSFATRTTTDLIEGDNQYYTDAKADARVNLQTGSNLDLSQKTTADLAEDTNLYYTDTRVNDKLGSGVDNIVTTGYLRGPSTFTIDPAGHGDNTGKVVIAGDLQVDGTTTTINSTELTIDDKVIEVASNATDTNEADGAGLSVGGTSATLTYTALFDGWTFNKSVDLNGNLLLSGGFFDSNNNNGTAGQALLSTGTATEWGNISTTLNVQADSGSSQAIDMLTENLDIAGGNGISTATTDNTVTVTLDNTDVTSGTYGASQTIPQITVDDQGRITNVTNITGQTGPTGATGPLPAGSVKMNFTTTSAIHAIQDGEIAVSEPKYTNIRSIRIAKENAAGTDITDFVRDVTTSSSFPSKGYVTITKISDPSKYLVLEMLAQSGEIDTVHSYEDTGNYILVPVDYVAGITGINPETNQGDDSFGLGDESEVAVSFVRAADAAPTVHGLKYLYFANTDLTTSFGSPFSNSKGHIQWDSTDLTTNNLKMRVAHVDYNDVDQEDFIRHITSSTASSKGFVTVINRWNRDKSVTFKITDTTYDTSDTHNTVISLEHIIGSTTVNNLNTANPTVHSSHIEYDILFERGADHGDIDTHLTTSSANTNEVLSWTGSAYDWVPQSGGIALTDISVNGTEGTAEGDGGIGYNNTTGVFTYTPPDLSSYLTSYTESDPVVGAIDGIVRANGSGTISAATGSTDGTGDYSTVKIGTGATDALAGDSGIEDLSNVSSSLSPISNSVLAYNTTDSEYQPSLLNDIAEIENQYLEVSTGGGVIAHRPYYASAWDGTNNRPIVTLTDADNEQPCIGIATETVGSGSVTKLLTKGILTNVNTGTTNYPGTGNLVYISSSQGGLTRTAPVAYQRNLQQVATVLKTDLSTGVLLVDITASQVGVANLPHNYIAYGGPNGEQTAQYDDVSLPIRASAGPSGSREYWNVLRLTDANNNYTGDINHIQIGQAEGVEDSQLVDKISLFPGASGVRIHNSEAIGTEGVTGQTLAFHTTDDGIHVGNDRRGTYTAGDLMINDDTDFGMLAGSTSSNYGSNNFGFGYQVDFASQTSSNLASGAIVDIKQNVSNSAAFGGVITLGSGANATSMFAGGFLTKTIKNYGFSWGYGYTNNVDTEEYATNSAVGGVLFGQQSILTSNATNSFVGGGIGGNSENFNNHRVDSTHSFNYGKSSHIAADSNHSGAIGLFHVLDTAPQGFAAGEVHRLTNTRSSAAVGRLHELGSIEHSTGNDYLFAAGYKNEPLGDGGACIGYELKTPLNRATSADSYEWEDGCTVVGAHNEPTKKFDTDDGVGATWVQNQRFVVGTGISATARKTGFVVAAPVIDSGNTTFSGIIMTHLAESDSYPNPADARTAGVPTGGLYRTGNDVKILLAGD